MTENKKGFNPKIIAFLCNWCGYVESDLKDVDQFQKDHTLRIVRVMCSGSIQLPLILDAFKNGSDGVMVCGCSPGNCHYISGNEKAEIRLNQAKEICDLLNINPNRIKLDLGSADKGKNLKDIINDFTDELNNLGPFEIEK